MIKAENQKLSLYGGESDGGLDVQTKEKVNQMIKAFSLDKIDMLGEQHMIHEEEMQIDQKGGGATTEGGAQQRFVEPFVYTLYRTEQPRYLEYAYRQAGQNKEMEIRASGGPFKS